MAPSKALSSREIWASPEDGIWRVKEEKDRVSSVLGLTDFLACLYWCVWCSVSLTRSVLGLRRGLWKMIFPCFCYESSSPRNWRNSPKWRRAPLNYSAFTINFCPPPPLISTPPWTTESAGSSWECWQFPVRCTLRPCGNMRGCGSMDFCEFAT